MKSWLQDNLIEIYSTPNEVKSAVAERFIRTLKKTIYKHMTSISIYKHAYIYTYIYIYIYIYIPTLHAFLYANFVCHYQNTKTFLLKTILQIGLKKLL